MTFQDECCEIIGKALALALTAIGAFIAVGMAIGFVELAYEVICAVLAGLYV